MNEKIRTEEFLQESDPANIRRGILKGIPSSDGIVIANAYLLSSDNLISPDEKINSDQIDNELERLDNAYSNLNIEFDTTLTKVKDSGAIIKSIIESNLMIINDEFIKNDIKDFIKQGFTAESSIIKEFELQKSFFKYSNDPILKERSIELDHIKQRLIGILKHQFIKFDEVKDRIIIANNITPTDLVNFMENGLKGIITEIGGIASHVSIMARAFMLPAVIGIKDACSILKNDDLIILDGFSGTLIYNPSEDLIERYLKKIEKIQKYRSQLGELIDVESKTTDGKRIILSANADKPEEVEQAILSGADSIGLVRSETLIMKLGYIPNCDYQFVYYNELAQIAYPKNITIRAFDIGSDKYSEGIPHHESNPALGFRGIRYLLARRDIFADQIKAVLRASVNRNVKFMLPMIISLDEVEQSLNLISQCKKDLDAQGIGYNKKIPIGIMIETPAAALLSDFLAKKVSFFSIGTNDLTQYTLAADRDNNLITEKYDSFHPAVLRLVKIIIESASKNNIEISVCGELAGNFAATTLLLGFGLNELSVAPSLILELKHKIIGTSFSEARILSDKILDLSSSEAVLEMLEHEPES